MNPSQEPVILGWIAVIAAAVGAKYGLKVNQDQVLAAAAVVGSVVTLLVRAKVIPAKKLASLENLVGRLEKAAENVAPIVHEVAAVPPPEPKPAPPTTVEPIVLPPVTPPTL